MFLIFISSVLYFIKKIKTENRANAAVIMISGISIDECIADFAVKLIEAGWCNVFHQSTENLIIGIFIAPKIAINEDILFTLSRSLKIRKDNR